jgi:hypothetical protein
MNSTKFLHLRTLQKEIHDKGLALLKKLKVHQDDDVYNDFADLNGAIEDATCKQIES